MRSARPKVVHTLAAKPLLGHVLDTARGLAPAGLHVVYGHGGEQVRAAFAELPDVRWIEQAEQLGTGHALAQAMPEIPDSHGVLVLYGDVPLLSAESLKPLLELPGDSLGLLTVNLETPTGYGRIVRDGQGRVEKIVEEKDADPAIRALTEINTGILAAPAARLRGWLRSLDRGNAQGEYYLTDIIGMAVRAGLAVQTFSPRHAYEVLGINDRVQLAQLERIYQLRQAESLMRQGVSLRDPARLEVRGTVQTGRDVEIDVNVILEGRVVLGERVRIGPNCLLRNVEIGDDAQVFANCVLEDSRVGPDCRIGPFARLRPHSVLAGGAHIGNFVEIKQSSIGEGSKINHLSYIGDTEMGSGVNIGAGTITCNYDGAYKHKTVIGDRVFVGSDTQLIAPVSVGAGATIGAGSTITQDPPPEQLTLSRSPQKTVPGWKRPVKKTG
jgi:bifunctional UDP-N-acetylglucosamine pyrophosphorylase/glucosamine-1-phosphate N-acetyltransferase